MEIVGDALVKAEVRMNDKRDREHAVHDGLKRGPLVNTLSIASWWGSRRRYRC